MSCDNLQGNGQLLEKLMHEYVDLFGEDLKSLAEWIRLNVTFPNSMVDRITPMTQPSDI
jgi:mannitol 2-dehydrogenase